MTPEEAVKHIEELNRKESRTQEEHDILSKAYVIAMDSELVEIDSDNKFVIRKETT